MDERLNVLFITNIPSPYVIDYLNELSKYCKVTALFETKTAKDREDKWYKNEQIAFEHIFLRGMRIGVDSALCMQVIKYLKDKIFDRIIIANPTTPTGIVALLFCRWFNVAHVLQSEGGVQGTGIGLKEKFKKYIMESADLYLTGMGRENDYFLKYGANKEQLCFYPFTSLNNADLLYAREQSHNKVCY